MKRVLIAALFTIMAFATAHAQDSAYARRIIQTLSSDRMYGRGFCHHGDSLAAQFLSSEMKRLGLLPLQVDYMQHYTLDCYSFNGPTSLSINGIELEPYSQFRVLPAAQLSRSNKLEKAKWSKQLKDGTWVIGVPQLDTYSPIAGPEKANPVFIEVIDTLITKRVRKVNADIPLQFHKDYRTQNVVGYVRGVIDSMIVFTAHYDHCGTMGEGIVFHGAHDNASGVAAVMDLARIAASQKPYYTMVFMLFSGEESGLLGSHYAAENHLIDYSKVKLLCNIDMLCGGDEGIMFFNATSKNTKQYYDQLKAMNDETHAAVEIRPRDNRPNSDHYWFSNYCPSIFLLTMGGPYGGYHDPADTCDECGLSHYNAYMQLIKQLAGLE